MAISQPLDVTLELRLMFWLLKGATRYPILWNIRQRAATVMDFPASEVAPRTMSAFPLCQNLLFASGKTSERNLGSPALRPSSLILSKVNSTTSGRWQKRQSSQDHTGFPWRDTTSYPIAGSLHG